MPIVERTARACFDRFADHVRGLLAATLTRTYQARVVAYHNDEERAVLRFTTAGGDPVPLRCGTFGTLYVWLSQELIALRDGKSPSHRLRTLRYWYRIQAHSDPKAQALIRWEYAPPEAAGPCRHHVQLAAKIPAGRMGTSAELDFNRLHVPTGWVTLEEVIRFLIVELGHKPPCGAAWPAVLEDSERAFFEQFTGKRYKPG